MPISRRHFMKNSTVALVAGPGLMMQGCLITEPEAIFAHGVSSGDPLSDRVILWTRITVPKSMKITDNQTVTASWKIATDEALGNIVNQGTADTQSNQDFTVKVDADGLEPGQHYYYQFEFSGVKSPVGRTKTLPAENVEQVKIAFTSCSHYSFGYFNVYARMAEQDVDVVLHLGDYLYEYGNKDIYRNPFLLDRRHQPEGEMISLSDYRTRHGQYKRDKDLQTLHQTHPMICIWDDHEFTNDTWRGGAENHTEGLEGTWEDRAKAALQAYYEWMPIREPGQRGFDDRERAYRRFRFGQLVDLNMLDTRYVGRDKQITSFDGSELNEDRTLLGFDQESWLESNLLQAKQEGVQWKLLGQQVQMLQIRLFGQYQNADAWDGYQAARNRLLNFIDKNAIDNVAILTGDVHSSWAAEITNNPYEFAQYNPFTGEGAKAVEFVTPSVTSPSIPVPGLQQIVGDAAQVVRLENQHIRYVDFKNRGFVILTIDQKQIQADWYHVAYVSFPNQLLTHAKRFTVKSGDARLHPRF